jgi:hypothetical protein
VQVHRRLVIHVQGYDARSLAENFDRFQREYARACELYGLSGEVRAAVEARDGMSGMWDVATRGEGWQV